MTRFPNIALDTGNETMKYHLAGLFWRIRILTIKKLYSSMINDFAMLFRRHKINLMSVTVCVCVCRSVSLWSDFPRLIFHGRQKLKHEKAQLNEDKLRRKFQFVKKTVSKTSLSWKMISARIVFRFFLRHKTVWWTLSNNYGTRTKSIKLSTLSKFSELLFHASALTHSLTRFHLQPFFFFLCLEEKFPFALNCYLFLAAHFSPSSGLSYRHKY